MPTWRAQIAVGGDSQLIRDRFVMNPHYTGAGPADWHVATDAFATALATYFAGPREVKVTVYPADATPPNYPVDSAVVNANLFPASSGPREVALCLSYYSGLNIPRRRGRLYVPIAAMQSVSSTRPTTAQQNKVAALVPILEGFGGTSLSWSVYSRTDDAAFPLTNWYVDDEWDIIRSRGMRPTARISGAVSG